MQKTLRDQFNKLNEEIDNEAKILGISPMDFSIILKSQGRRYSKLKQLIEEMRDTYGFYSGMFITPSTLFNVCEKMFNLLIKENGRPIQPNTGNTSTED